MLVGWGFGIVKVFWGSSPPFLLLGIRYGVEAFVSLLVLGETPQVAYIVETSWLSHVPQALAVVDTMA